MKKSLVLLAVVAVMATLLPTSAVGESYDVSPGVGYRCTANTVVPNQTLLVAGEPATDVLRMVPRGGKGVIASWGIRVAPEIGPIGQQLVVFEPLGNGEYRKVAESRLETVDGGPGGTTSFRTRIPVKGGEAIGIFGPDGTLACDSTAETTERDSKGERATVADALSLRAAGHVPVGSSMIFEPVTGIATPLQTGVDEDRDGDGYGDDSQDRCPGSASKGSQCPIDVKIDSTVFLRTLEIEVVPETWARFDIFGYVLWHDASADRLTGVNLEARGPKRVSARRRGEFKMPLPKRLIRQLERRRRGNPMVARVEVHVTDRHGWESAKYRRVVLPGRR